MRDYQKLDVWKKAHLFTLQVYKEILPIMPIEEKFALTQQIRRATYSIPLNIVEGSGKTQIRILFIILITHLALQKK